ncbi:MAG: transposase [Bacteroidetes bacterium]|nr:transposase [Bacteroidota bacterium]MBU1113521.1 transposase [Bacteroidota bacterium]MBU1797469.1 transposase [Bacteroidota bacterium]
MDKPREYFQNTYHHLYNRGANKSNIFFDKESYLYFLKRLKYYKEKYQIEVLSYCLMPNHFHLFVKQETTDLLISEFISALLNSYVKSINKKFNRSGTLFQSKTKSKPITDEHYFIWIIKYILENPVKAKLVQTISDWEFSNAKDLLNMRRGTLTNLKEVNSFFQSEEQMIKFLTDSKINVDYEF